MRSILMQLHLETAITTTPSPPPSPPPPPPPPAAAAVATSWRCRRGLVPTGARELVHRLAMPCWCTSRRAVRTKSNGHDQLDTGLHPVGSDVNGKSSTRRSKSANHSVTPRLSYAGGTSVNSVLTPTTPALAPKTCIRHTAVLMRCGSSWSVAIARRGARSIKCST